MATGSFQDKTSSNGMSDNWIAKVEYETTQYAGYTMVKATLKLTTSYTWNATLTNNYSLTINGNTKTGSGATVPSGGTKTLLTHSVRVNHTSDKSITISAKINANNIYYNSGGYYIGTYTPSKSITLKALPTDCGAPTTFTVSPSPFTTSVTLNWSGASGGNVNSISSYYIQYCTSSNNSTWGNWTGLTTVTSTSKSGNKTIDMSSKVSNTHYVKFRIRTQGSAGSDYYSGYKTASSIRRIYYTACTAPTTFTVSSNNFESNVTLTWGGATAGTNNSIQRYYIQYAVSSNNSTWSSWSSLQSSDLTPVGTTTTTVDISSKVTRGYYVKFQIRTEGSAGSSYYSSYKTSSSIRRNPYTKCGAPTSFTMTSDMGSTSQFDIKVTLGWSGATSGSNNTINSYLIRYRTSSDKSTWGGWKDLKNVSTTKTSGSTTVDLSSLVTRKHYVEFAIKTQGSAGSSYYSDWKFYQTSLQRNPYTKCGKPKSVTIKSEADIDGVTHNNVFNSKITITWSSATAGENNAIKRYYIEYCTSSNNSTWNSWATLQSSNLTPVGTTTTSVNIVDKVNRGVYVKIRIRTEGEAGSTYYSDYVESTSIRRNSIPTAPTKLTFSSHPSLEYSDGETITLSWNYANDIDNNLRHYKLEASVNSGSWVIINEQITSSQYSYNILPTSDIYKQVENGGQIKFRIRAYDKFGEGSSSYTTSSTLTRYDISGVAIGRNGKWVNCQLFVGVNGEWIEQEVSAGINGAWVEADDGV